MSKYLYFISIFIFLILSNRVCSENFYFDQISLKEGLSQSLVKVVYRDHTGMLWIGTKEGLNRYDGSEIKTYYHDSKINESLPNNNISVIIEDSLNNLWIGSDGVLCRYDRLSDSFIKEEINGKEISFHNALVVGHMLYSATTNAIYSYNCLNKQWTNKTFYGVESIVPVSTKLEKWNNGKLIIGSRWKGLFICNPQTGELTRTSFFKSSNILDIYQDSKNQLWISEYGEGVVCFNRKGSKIVDFQGKKSPGKMDKVMGILEYNHQIWMATDGNGIFVYSPQKNDIYQIKHDQNNPFSLPINSFLTLHRDKYSNLWLGTIRGGLLAVRNTFIQSYVNSPLNSSSGLSEQTVLSFFEDNAETIWVGTDGEGINSYNPKTLKFKHYPSTFGKKVSSITSLSDRKLLISLYNEGIVLFDKQNGQLSKFPLTMTDGKPLALNNLIGSNLLNAGDGNIYICDGNVYSCSISTGKVKLLKHADNYDGAIKMYFRSKVPSQLVLYDNCKVLTFDLKTGVLHKICKTDEATMGTINTLEIDKYGTLWLGMSSGLFSWNKNKKQFERVISNQFKSISMLVGDNSGSLWIGSGLELFKYQITKHELYNYGKSDGVNPNEFLTKSKLISKSGDVYIGGVSGFIRINKQIPMKKQDTPVFELLNIQLDGSLLPSNRLVDRNGDKSINIPWNFTSLSVNIFTNTRDLNSKVHCRYSFQEKENSYHEIEKRTIQLQNLSIGKYTLQVEYELKTNSWSKPVTLLYINVTPPWWRTWWFYVLSVLIIVGSLFRFRQNAITKTKRSMEVEMERRERGVSEQKLKFMINISHELRTPLTLVYSPLQRLLHENEIPATLQPTLNLMYKHVKNMKNMIDMVLDLRKMDVVTDSLKLKNHHVNTWIRNLANDFQLEIQDKKITLKLELDDTINELAFDEEKCDKVLSNLIMNAIKFSEPNTTIQIKSKLTDKGVHISVTDEGIGVSPEDAKQLFTRFYQGNHDKGGTGIGLSYSKTQVELHNGTIGYEPGIKKGSIFWFELPFRELNEISTNTFHQIFIESDVEKLNNIEKTDFSELKKLTVVIVEDQIDLLNYLKDSLTPIFKNVIAVVDGQKGLEQVYRNMPDFVISDVMMPVMDGFEMCRRIKTDIEISHIPVVLLSALRDEESSLIGYKMGADMYLSKPFSIDYLLTVIINLNKYRSELKKKYTNLNITLDPKDLTFSNADEQFLIKFISILEDRLDDSNLEIDLLAREMAMSRTSFYNKMKIVTGMSVNVFITDYKIKRACLLLRQSNLSIQDISSQLGFVSQRYFSTVFKQVTEKTPTQYRGEMQDNK